MPNVLRVFMDKSFCSEVGLTYAELKLNVRTGCTLFPPPPPPPPSFLFFPFSILFHLIIVKKLRMKKYCQTSRCFRNFW